MAKSQPICFIIAGPNGAGKTTFAMKYLPRLGCLNFINADEIARGLSPLNESSALLPAGKIFLNKIDEHIVARQTFAFETTLSGRAYLSKIQNWRKAGWRIELFYLYLPNANVSASRVAMRVQQGGHDIPADALERRYPRSLENLFDYMKHCDAVHCLDNSGSDIIPIFAKDSQGVKVYHADLFNQIRKYAHD